MHMPFVLSRSFAVSMALASASMQSGAADFRPVDPTAYAGEPGRCINPSPGSGKKNTHVATPPGAAGTQVFVTCEAVPVTPAPSTAGASRSSSAPSATSDGASAPNTPASAASSVDPARGGADPKPRALARNDSTSHVDWNSLVPAVLTKLVVLSTRGRRTPSAHAITVRDGLIYAQTAPLCHNRNCALWPTTVTRP